MDIEGASEAVVANLYNPVLARKPHVGSVGVHLLLAYGEQAVKVMPELCLDRSRDTTDCHDQDKEFAYVYLKHELSRIDN